MCGMKLWVSLSGKWEGMVSLMRRWRAEVIGDDGLGMSQREDPGMVIKLDAS